MPLRQRLPRTAWSVLLEQSLDGLRQGGIPPWPHGRWPKLKSRLERHWLGPIWGTWGDLVPAHERWPTAVQVLLHWACGLVRPDHQVDRGLDEIPDTAWIEQTAWRPILALVATSSLLPVPKLPHHYRRSPGESALEALCGIWAVGASTTYRYVEKGRRSVVDMLAVIHDSSLDRWALRNVAAKARYANMSKGWHQLQAKNLAQHGHAVDAAWHLWRCEDWISLAEHLNRRALSIATSPECRSLLQAIRRSIADPFAKVITTLGESVVWRCFGNADAELSCIQLALRTANHVPEPLKLLCNARALYAMGYFLNAREPDQAIGHLELAAQQFLIASQKLPAAYHDQVQSGYVTTLATMAFVQLRRQNPQAQVLLRSAVSAAQECLNLEIDAEGMLLKAQAEEARCSDDTELAIRYRQQALVLYERAGDQKELVESQCNLGQLFAVAGRPDEARLYCGRVIETGRLLYIRPETLLSAHGGMALAAITLHELNQALRHLELTLSLCRQFGLRRHEVTTLDNLAEVHRLRFVDSGNSEEEELARRFATEARNLAESLGLAPQSLADVSQSALSSSTATHHLLPIETSAHPGEFSKIEALRAELALPRPPAQRARTHIALSQLYLRIAAKERDAARGLMQTHGLGELEADIEALQQTWTHDGNLASQLSSRWREQVGDWLTDSQRKAVLERLLAEGSLSKSSYGEAAEVSPATASKHLGLLADKGLLEQQGRGPATRYVLPSRQNSGGRDGVGPAGSPGSVH